MDDNSYAGLSPFSVPSPLDASISAPEAVLPSYLIGADSHNYANGNFAFTDPTTWGTGLENSGKFILGAAYSGINSMYNSGVAVANWFGADADYNDTATGLANIDSDLGEYYQAHQQGEDLAGFILTSIVPGMGGIKLLNAGQKILTAAADTGALGTTLSRAVGLLKPAQVYAKAAASEIATAQASFSYINASTIKALAAGVGQNVLEGAAFETAVVATNFKSPVLKDADGWAIAKDIALGALTQGAIGGAFSAAKTVGTIKKALKPADLAEKPYTLTTELGSGSSSADRIITAAGDIDSTPVAPATGDMAVKFTRLRTQKIDNLNLAIRTNVHSMVAGGDVEFGNQVANIIQGLPEQQITANFQYAEQLGRVSSELAAEKVIKKAAAVALPGTSSPYKVGYVKLFGENAGNAYFDSAPAVLNIADTVKTSADVLDNIKAYGFKEKTLWNPVQNGTDHLEAEARYWWADKAAKISDAMRVHEWDIPLQERILKDWNAQSRSQQPLELGDSTSALKTITLVDKDGGAYQVTNPDDLLRGIRRSKQEVANELLAQKAADPASPNSVDAIAKIVNVRKSYLQGTQAKVESDDLFAHQFAATQYTNQMIAKGLWNTGKGTIDTTMLPSWMKVSYNIAPIQGADGMLLSGMAYQMAKQKIIAGAVQNVFAKYAGNLADIFTPLDSTDVLYSHRLGAGPGRISFASGNYGSTESKVEAIGHACAQLQKTVKDGTREVLQPAGYALISKQEAAIEFAAINNLIASTSEHYVLNAAGDALVPRALKQYQDAIQAGQKNLKPPTIQEGAPLSIPIKNQETSDAVKAHIDLNGGRIGSEQELRAAQGLENQKDPETFYPVRPNPRDYQHFAFVVDSTVTSGSAGHTTMIHAADSSTLEKLIDKVPTDFKVITKQQSEAYHKAMQDYEFDRTLHESHINPALQRAGVNSQFFQQTDPKRIVQDWLADHLRRDDVLVREMVNGLYEPQFQELRKLGEQYTGIDTSKYGGTYKYAENTVKNPYLNYVKTALNINQANEYPLLNGLNTIVDRTFSNAMKTVQNLWDSTKSPADLEKINSALKDYGVKTAFQDAATNLLANHSAGRGALGNFVRKANSIMSLLVLQLDPLNAIVNALGATTLLGSETKSIFRSISNGNSDAAGALAQLKDILVPGTNDSITSAPKLIASAMRDFVQNDSANLKARYLKNGWMTPLRDQFRSMLDDFTLNGTEDVGQLNKRIQQAFTKAKALAEKGTVLSGNKLAEDFNRFVAANVMDKITDVAVQHGLIGTAEKTSYINSFVNRTQGNILASQRPIIFQGPVGQAIGLFQTYQFNLMQQMFRHISEGSPKDAAMLLGLQGTLYGLNGLPAFNYINTHIVGTLSGNPQHTDLYSGTYGIFGKTVGNWLLYGAPSNLLQTNLYSRGDINPRQVTVIPTNPADIPIIGATTALFSNLKNMAGKIQAGGSVWETLLQGIEHNGLSRPLAGLAQEAQALGPGGYTFSTSSKGTILGTNDLLSLASISRLAGGRPIDEAITNDAVFRMSVYGAVDQERKQALNESIKSSVIAGHIPDGSQIDAFSAGYAALGGDQKRFNAYMMKQITSANTPQAEVLMRNLKSPYSQNMQQIMGGRDDVYANINTPQR